MKITVTCVTSEEAGALLGEISLWLQNFLIKNFDGSAYAKFFDQIVIVFIAVESDPGRNERFISSHDRCGRYKDFKTKERVRYVGLAVKIDPESVLNSGDPYSVVLSALNKRLLTPILKAPKGAQADSLSSQLRNTLLNITSPF